MKELVFFCVSTIGKRYHLMVFPDNNIYTRYMLPVARIEDGAEISIQDIVKGIEEKSGYEIRTMVEKGTEIEQKLVYFLDKKKLEEANENKQNLVKLHYLIIFKEMESSEENLQVFRELSDVAIKISPTQKKDFAELINFFESENFNDKYSVTVEIVKTYEDLEQSI